MRKSLIAMTLNCEILSLATALCRAVALAYPKAEAALAMPPCRRVNVEMLLPVQSALSLRTVSGARNRCRLSRTPCHLRPPPLLGCAEEVPIGVGDQAG